MKAQILDQVQVQGQVDTKAIVIIYHQVRLAQQLTDIQKAIQTPPITNIRQQQLRQPPTLTTKEDSHHNHL